MSYIIKFLISRPLISRLILSFLIVASVVSIMKIKRLGYPRADYEMVTITTYYPGASPEDVELNITVKLEEALKEIDGIEKYLSRSIENVSIIDVYLDPNGEDKKKTKDEIRRAIEGVTDLPAELEKKPEVLERTVDNWHIYEMALVLPGKDRMALRRHGMELKRRLLEIDLIARVKEHGIKDREIQVQLNREKMSGLSIGFDEVIQSIKLNKLRLSGGNLESYTTEKGIVTFSEFASPGDVGNIIIRSGDLGGPKIRINDVGKVIDGFEDMNSLVRYNGMNGMSLWIYKKGTSDVIDTVEKIEELVREYKAKNAPRELKIFSTYDDSLETNYRLTLLRDNAIFGFILVLGVLFLFLDRRTAFWTAFGIPVSMGVTITLMAILDISVNSVSLCGLIVVLGMVVDDAIVISESIYIARRQGMSPAEASIYGLKMVVKPVFGTIFTTIVAFFPMFFIPGIIGNFAVDIPFVVIIMLSASFAEATLMLPVHLAHARGFSKEEKAPPGEKFLVSLEEFYKKILTWILLHRGKAFLFFSAFLVVGSLLSVLMTRFNLFPIDQANQIWISGNAPHDSNIDFTSRQAAVVERIIQSLPRGTVYAYKTEVGWDFNNFMYIPSVNSFYIHLILTPAAERDMAALDVKEYIQKRLKKKKDASISNLNFLIYGGAPPVGKPLEIKVIGNDNETRNRIIGEITKELKKLPVSEIDSDYRKGKEEIRLIPNYDTVALAKLNVTAIATTIRTAFDGTVVTHLQTPDEKIPFRVKLDSQSKDFSDPLGGLFVRSPMGLPVPLKVLVHETKSHSPQNIFHFNGYRTNTITANIDLERTSPGEIYSILKDKYSSYEKKYPGFKIVFGGEAEESARMFVNLLLAVLIAVTAIYFIVSIQFNSLLQPVMVLAPLPFGLVGITLALGVQFLDLSMLSFLGILGFTGVAVNDSIVMVDFINRIRRKEISSESDTAIVPEGELGIDEFHGQVIDGARRRLRPVLLTTITTVAGLIPTAYGFVGGTDSFISPMAMALSWGLIFGTIATLVIIPVFYSILHSFGDVFRKKVVDRIAGLFSFRF